MNELSIDLLPMNETQTENYGMFIPYGGEMDFTYAPCWFRIYQKLHLRVKSKWCTLLGMEIDTLEKDTVQYCLFLKLWLIKSVN